MRVFRIYNFIVIVLFITVINFFKVMDFLGSANLFVIIAVFALIFISYYIYSRILDKLVNVRLITKLIFVAIIIVIFYLWESMVVISNRNMRQSLYSSGYKFEHAYFIAYQLFQNSVYQYEGKYAFKNNYNDLNLPSEMFGKKYNIQKFNKDTIKVECEGYISSLFIEVNDSTFFIEKDETRKKN
ncbi:TPA: hypothetical protein DCR49_10670 [Candidatus Delongbacteria bacterium]|nr:hypothetical protein [Candidatus Delongbacteria bacterium]